MSQFTILSYALQKQPMEPVVTVFDHSSTHLRPRMRNTQEYPIKGKWSRKQPESSGNYQTHKQEKGKDT